MRKNPAYPGKLGEPLKPLPGPPTLLGHYLEGQRETTHDELVEILREEFDKLPLLLHHFGITEADPQCWFLLSLSLARAHVPGFQRRAQPGRKKAWDVFTDAEVKIALEDLLQESKRDSNAKGVSWACSVLAEREPWKSNLGKAKKPAEILRQAYYRADESWVQAVCEVQRHQLSIAERAVTKP